MITLFLKQSLHGGSGPVEGGARELFYSADRGLSRVNRDLL